MNISTVLIVLHIIHTSNNNKQLHGKGE